MSAIRIAKCPISNIEIGVYEKSVSVLGHFLYLKEKPTANFVNSFMENY